MRAEVAAWCRRERLLAPGDRVICALSGGADSVALLCLLLELRQELGLTVSAAHFHHGLRGAEADRDEAFVRALCAERDVPLTVGRGDVAAEAARTHESPELAARRLRYAFLLGLDGDRVATAHHAGDNAETILLHLLRGSGLRGLSGIPPVNGRVVRPLLPFTHERLCAYLRANGVAWIEDSTNSADDCRRNRLRHEVLPLLERENPSLLRQLTRQSALLRAEDAFLDRQAQSLLDAVRTPSGGYACRTLLEADEVLQGRAIRLLLREALPQDASQRHVEAVRRLLSAPSPSASASLPHGVLAARRYGEITVTVPKQTDFQPIPLKIDGETAIPAAGWKIFSQTVKKYQETANTPFQFAVKYDMIVESNLIVRPRRPGDRLQRVGGSKSLKELFIDRKIPRADRALLPVFAAQGEILAVAGLGVSSKFQPQAGAPALWIRIEKERM